jgi:hypothetical protein
MRAMLTALAMVGFVLGGPAPLLASTFAPTVSPRPAPRPEMPTTDVQIVEVLSTSGMIQSPRPEARPRNLTRGHTVRVAGIRTQPDPGAITGRGGALCGVGDLGGETLSPIAGRISGCGIDAPVRLTSVAGVALSQPATVDCPTALALRTWVKDAVLPTIGTRGGGVKSLNVAGHYVCRTRNNQKGAQISEHGRGRAIDISGIALKNGSVMTVLRGWRDPNQGPILQSLHRAACGPFGTVLGPRSDGFHQDHFHFDTASYRSGTYCR